ncbi:hypothetical protein Mapa_007819 [Marchantia paleacea]|nr:hypothetical protein Mapa_007819 [Marchantia paleacea]
MFVEPRPGKRSPHNLRLPYPAGANSRPRRRGKKQTTRLLSLPSQTQTPGATPSVEKASQAAQASARNGRLSVSDAVESRTTTGSQARTVSWSVRAGQRRRGERSRGPGLRDGEREVPSEARGGAGRERADELEQELEQTLFRGCCRCCSSTSTTVLLQGAGAKASKFGCTIFFSILEEEQEGGGVERALVVDRTDHARS